MKTQRDALFARLRMTMQIALVSLFVTSPAHAQVSIANGPLFLTPSVDTNILFLLDDSGSMQWEIMPDEILYTNYLLPRASSLYGGSTYNSRIITFDDSDIVNVYVRSSYNNAIFYDPQITYQPWVDALGGPYISSNPATAAYHNPANTGLGSVNLTVVQSFDRWRSWTGSAWVDSDIAATFYPITFYHYKGSGEVFAPANYVKYQIRGTTGYQTDLDGGSENTIPEFVWANGITRTVAQEAQNFANWYTFYRSRILAARGGIGRAFATQPENLRIGFGTINSESRNVDGVSTQTVISGVRPFQGTSRTAFFTSLYGHTIGTSGTPLRRALDDTGQYFSRSDSSGPWSTTPGVAGGVDLSCRQNYTILMTDGYWNGSAASTTAAQGNVDNSTGPSITNPNGPSFQYTPADPFRDDWSNTLADVAMYYWKRDLRTDLVNNVPRTSANPAYWQHMVTFGVGLGVTGSIDPATAWSALGTGSPIAWPQPSASAGAPNIDDLLHAAVNSRGGFFSASDPDTFTNELAAVLDAIGARIEDSSTAAAASSAVLQTNTLLYTAGFRSTDWSGELKAYTLDTDGNRDQLAWDAEARLRATSPASRKIFTRNSVTNAAVSLNNLSDLSTVQQAALNHPDSLGAARINWIRGTEHASLRSRQTPTDGLRLLGDIVNSNPQFVGRRNFGYRILPGTEGSSYDTFRATTTYRDRPDVLYVGANDGLLHAFDATTGNELFAYMPSELLRPHSASHARINELMDPNYTHRYFVDGESTVGDAYWGGTWKSVLVGSTGAGGRTVFALDVTDPESFGAGNVLWEFGYADADCEPLVKACREIGYGIGQPAIARVRTAANTYEWAAIFGNGYNSASHKAQLFVVRLSNGELIRAIDTGQGTLAAPNGLASPATTDWPTMDLTTRMVYAGDLHGRMWRFDIAHQQRNNWSANTLFQAKDALGVNQPITSRPALAADPEVATRLVVLFGTGSYFRPSDASLLQVNSLYGIFDDGSSSVSARSELLEQSITWQDTIPFTTPDGTTDVLARKISDNQLISTHKGWYLDLVYGTPDGERVISTPTFPSGIDQRRVRFTTLIPDDDPCGFGRSGFVFDISLASGARTANPVYDLNLDGAFDADDMHEGDVVSAIGGSRGERLTVIRDGDGSREFLYGGQDKIAEGLGAAEILARKSWRQLR